MTSNYQDKYNKLFRQWVDEALTVFRELRESIGPEDAALEFLYLVDEALKKGLEEVYESALITIDRRALEEAERIIKRYQKMYKLRG